MNKQELTDWAIDIFWPSYKNLCKTPFPTKWMGGPRGAAVKKIQILNPSEDLRQRILAGIQAQIIHRNKLYQKLGSMQAWNNHTEKNKFYCNRNGETWINQIGWDDEIPQIEGDGLKQGIKKCHCGRDVHGPQFDECDTHYCMDKRGRIKDILGKVLKDGKMVDVYPSMPPRILREYYVKQDINSIHIKSLIKPGNISDIMKIINVWSNTAHNAHVRERNVYRYSINKPNNNHK